MKDFLKKFQTTVNYNTWKSSENYIEPNVSYITENGGSVEYAKLTEEFKKQKYVKMYFTFEAIEDTTFTFTKNALQYSLDNGSTWATLAASTASPTVTAGNKIMWKQTGLTPTSTGSGIGKFSATGNFKAYGNIMSLYYGDNFIGQTDLTGKNYAFYRLFYQNAKLVDISNLILSATTLASSCYELMFYGCTSLTTAPALPATTLAQSCYKEMFNSCTALTTVPTTLPATILAESCYQYMFSNCTSLTIAPALQATTLADNCYYGMFKNCTALITAPALQATTLADNCYKQMFYCCSSLVTPSELPATSLTYGCYYSMFYGCTSLTTAPALSAITLALYCYYGMFQGCTSLTTAPELPATTLTDNCYTYMFSGCTSLNYIKCLATDISATTCTVNWVDNVAASGTFVKNASADWSSKTGTSGIPSGWTVQDAA